MTRTSRSPRAARPIGFAQHLTKSRDDHRPAPDDGRFFIDQETHRHDLEAPAFERLDDLAVRHLRLACNAEETRLRRSVDVGVDDADLQSDCLQPERQIDGDGRFADAAFAGGNGDHVLDARYALHRSCRHALRPLRPDAALRRRPSRLWPVLPARVDARGWWLAGLEPRGCAGARLRCQHRAHTGNTLDFGNDFLGSLAKLFQLFGARRRYRDREVDAIILDEDFGDETEIDDVAFEIGALNPAQRREHL